MQKRTFPDGVGSARSRRSLGFPQSVKGARGSSRNRFGGWGVQDIPGGNLQGVVLGACHWAAGAHLVAADGPAPPCCVLLKRGSYSAAASLWIDSEGLDIAFQERFVIVQYRGPASSAPITWTRECRKATHRVPSKAAST